MDLVFLCFLGFLLGSGGEEPEELNGEKKQPRDPGSEPDPATVQQGDLELLTAHISEMTHRVTVGPLL